MLCKTCLEDKNLEEFYITQNGNRRNQCKDCSRIAKYRRKNKDKEIKSLLKKNVRNIEKGKSYSIKAVKNSRSRRDFQGKVVEIFNDFTLFESENGYKECFNDIDFNEKYYIQEIR